MRRITFLSGIIMMFVLTLSSSTFYMGKNKLQHIVLIQFKDSTTLDQLAEIEAAAMTLKGIKGVNDLKMSENVSPENLNQGYTHSLTMWFERETDRDEVYLPHSVHKAFVDLFVPQTEKVLVFDYWE
ncbi:MAG: Dabb family protein [Flavobacteriaceae bacterium]|nr:Dabb family protein [Flavobacteriaceae bacterium]